MSSNEKEPVLLTTETRICIRRPSNIPLIYVIGPFTASMNWEIQQNVHEAEQLAHKIALMGGMPVCPHTNSRNFHGFQTPQFWYAGTARMLEVCDVAVTLPTWEASKGSRDEVRDARLRGQAIFHFPEDDSKLLAWIEGFINPSLPETYSL